ncbi:MAG: LysR family transcriptional regulator [Rhodobacteraceae bacterium]|nr:LysR family transcriptional regulator [Paracoccaceae bacterium]
MSQANITLKQLRYLVALAEEKHFRRAAEVCGVSQPSLSVQLQKLEEQLGSRVVERGRAGVTFTPVGRDVVTRARSILMDVQAMSDFAQTAQYGLTGTIRLGVQATLGPYLMPRIAARLHREHPDFKLYIRESLPSQLEAELLAGKHDIILSKLPSRGADIVDAPLFQEPILFAVSADHPLATKDHVVPSDLTGLPVLSLSRGYHLHDQVHALCKEFGAEVIHDYEGTSLDALRQMVAMNMGTTFMPALYAKSEINKGGDVVALPLKGRRVFRSVGLFWRKGAGRAPAFVKLNNFVREVVQTDFQELMALESVVAQTK